MTDRCFDIIVVGAGPAGLGFCISNAQKSKRILILDAGKRLENRDSSVPEQVGNGVTGAGAYIDGKFSFFPAGTGLWRSSYHLLAASYQEMMRQFTSQNFFDSPVPPMPTVEEIAKYFFTPQDHWTVKRYESLYMSIPKREIFWTEIVRQVEESCTLQVETRVVSIEFADDGIIYLVKTICNGLEEVFYAQKVILAGGRFMPLQNLLKNIGSNLSTVFRRFEFGFRIEVPTSNIDIQQIRALGLKDPKLIMSPSVDVEYRTFCFCVDGQVSKSCVNGLLTCSGRADVEPTGRTNFAILVRTTNAAKISQEEICKFLSKSFLFTNETLSFQKDVLAFLSECPLIAQFILSAIDSLFFAYPHLNCTELRLHGPCLEGVGLYPNVDLHMHVKGTNNIYAIGDTHGKLRGLVPSFLSGLYLANVLQFKESAPLLLSKSAGKQAELAAVLGPLDRLDLGKDADLYDDVNRKVNHLFLLYKQSATYHFKKTLLIESTSLAIDCLGGEPKFAIGQFFESLGEEQFIEKTINSGATMICYLTLLCSETGIIIKETTGTCKGKMVFPRGTNGFGWDRMFVPFGQINSSKTFGEMELAEKNWLSARTIAANQLSNSFHK